MIFSYNLYLRFKTEINLYCVNLQNLYTIREDVSKFFQKKFCISVSFFIFLFEKNSEGVLDKKILELIKEKKLKKNEIRLIKRKSRHSAAQELDTKDLLKFGSVWGVEDRAVPFDYNRKEDDYKNALRPCLVLGTPFNFNSYDSVKTAPGTSIPHPFGFKKPPCIKAEVPPENLKKTTFFLIYFQWYSRQSELEKYFTELSEPLLNLTQKLMEGENER